MSTHAGSPYTRHAVSRPFTFVASLAILLAYLAWLRKPERLLTWGDEKRLHSRIKMMIWTRKRLRWLSALSGDVKKDLAYFREQL
jgi:hypothetical protein